MRSATLTMLMTCTIFLAATSALAEILPIAQSRSVTCSAYAEDASTYDSDSDADSAPDFAPFFGAVSATIQLDGALGSGSAHQTSSIEPNRISVTGGCAANGEGWEFEGTGSGSGSTSFSCEFTITTATTFTLTGYIDAYDSGDALLSLTGSGTFFDRYAMNSEEILDESGDLEPGTYLLEVEATSSAYGDYSYYGYAYGGFDLVFELEATSAVPRLDEGLSLTVGPNPFSGRTQIAYSTPVQGSIELDVFDVRGRRLQSFATAGTPSAVLNWDGRDAGGRSLAPGLYFLVLKSGDEVRRKKIMLVD